jgi:hypothetical protein
MAQRQFVLVLLALFGVLALVLAATGVYEIVGYRAVRRTREIGVRVAIGARAPDVVRLLVLEGAMFAMGGVAIGLIAANGSSDGYQLIERIRRRDAADGGRLPVFRCGPRVPSRVPFGNTKCCRLVRPVPCN